MSVTKSLGVALVLFGSAVAANAQDATEYALQCVEAIGPIPEFSCLDGTVIPVTSGGVAVTFENFTKGQTCDHPSLLDNGPDSDGQCVPNSRVLNMSTATAQVSAMCRQQHIREDGSLLFDEIDVIAHNPATGATCWFQATTSDPDDPIDGMLVTSPTSPNTDVFWSDPETVLSDGCGNCHDNDPFMYSPFMGQVWEAVPANPLGPYFHVGAQFGFDQWPTQVITPRDNTCLGCHRIGIRETCEQLTEWMTGLSIPIGANTQAQQFPLSHAMPPEHGLTLPAWTTFHKQSLNQIRSCCEDPEQQICQLTELPKYAQ